MSAQSDFHSTLDRAGGLLLDATCSARAGAFRPLPEAHRRLVRRAIGRMESAQQDLLRARSQPWDPPRPTPQMSLL